MNVPSQFSRLALGLVLSAGFVPLLSATPAVAQWAESQTPLQEFKPQENRNPFGGGSPAGMLDIIHRANLGNGRSLSEFSSDQRENLDSAASEFRMLQLQRMRRPNPTPPAPTPLPTLEPER